jgi:predicted TIM-barrel fold metal-dependent hydrolase
MFGRRDAVLEGEAQPVVGAAFEPPPNSCDCAVHVFDPHRYPYWSGRSYTPEPATVEDLRRFLQTLGLDRVVIVQATVYGADNSCVLDGIRTLAGRARGVAMIDEATSDASLDEMNRGGVRGIRENLGNLAASDPASARQRLRFAAERAGSRGWHVQVSAQLPTLEILAEDLAELPVPVVIDHFGEVRAARGPEQPGFATVVQLVSEGAYVKISQPDLISAREDLADVAPFARALVAANPRRILWGTAWPHPSAGAVPGRSATDLAPNRPIDDQKVLDLLPEWVPDSALRQLILVDNPARLYGF